MNWPMWVIVWLGCIAQGFIAGFFAAMTYYGFPS